jgi:hypothetical protein
LLVISIYSAGVIGMHYRFALCLENKSWHMFYLAAVSIVAWLALTADFTFSEANSLLFTIVPGVILASFFVLKQRNRLPFTNELEPNNQMFELGMHSYLLITYVLSCLALNDYSMSLAIAPLLAVHGATILFLKSRTTITVRYSFSLILLGIAKLALIDAANVMLWQKVMLFIGIGVFILFASFWYQKLVSKDADLVGSAVIE